MSNRLYTLAYNNRGKAKYFLKDYQGAIADFIKAIEIDPKFAQAYKNRGEAKNSFGDFQAATDDFNKVLELEIESELKRRVDLLKVKELEY
ncbi:tetratricopeptide repeat protein [Synechococcus sp. PCC 7502]|uniref:tetratricopeptide repeat protein n=1 Tax=Synechococcus sp. PCC 7502 TaxID=1173263 RepID=UPI0009DA687D|nr:tetratricopeptide repeat protein [Synechococcus sp. PCC 7502]